MGILMNMPGFSYGGWHESDSSHYWPSQIDQVAEQVRDALFRASSTACSACSSDWVSRSSSRKCSKWTRCLAAGMDDYVAEPIPVDALVEALTQVRPGDAA